MARSDALKRYWKRIKEESGNSGDSINETRHINKLRKMREREETREDKKRQRLHKKYDKIRDFLSEQGIDGSMNYPDMMTALSDFDFFEDEIPGAEKEDIEKAAAALRYSYLRGLEYEESIDDLIDWGEDWRDHISGKRRK